MDKKIRKIIKDTKKIERQEKSLLKEDKKHDKVIIKAKKKISTAHHKNKVSKRK